MKSVKLGRVIPPFVAACFVAACSSSVLEGGEDSETHFSCSMDQDCRPLGSEWVCVARICERAPSAAKPDPSESSDASAAPVSPPPEDEPPPLVEDPPEDPVADLREFQVVSISGPLTLAPDLDIPSEGLRVAVLWTPGPMIYPTPTSTSGMCEHGYAPVEYVGVVGQDQPLFVTGFPARYELLLNERPPANGLAPLSHFDGGTGDWTTGQIVVYRDGNANGQLDFRALDEAGEDEVLGASSSWIGPFGEEKNTVSHLLYYSDRLLANLDEPITPGFNLFRDVSQLTTNERIKIAPTEDVPIELRLAHRIQTLDCSEVCFEEREQLECPIAPSGLPADGNGICYPATSEFYAGYDWTRTFCDGCRCWGDACYYALDPGLPVPDGWPCSP